MKNIQDVVKLICHAIELDDLVNSFLDSILVPKINKFNLKFISFKVIIEVSESRILESKHSISLNDLFLFFT